MEPREFPVAHLKNETLQKLQALENELREQTNEEIVLIAYQNQKDGQDNITTG
ncbi:hypothetical protein [Pseudalkalibacillus caeni]|uniref:hypothetical protein n=1 Tax=Exobacillus caeni TaxID=2574798 RepID=UPI00148505C5|nr:hypothetical protein [Pseudalkalibacillus caeni]